MSVTAINLWFRGRGFRLTHIASGISVRFRTKTVQPKPGDVATARRWLSSLVAHAERPKAEPIRRSYILAPEQSARVVQGASTIAGEQLAEGREAVLAMLAGRIPGPK